MNAGALFSEFSGAKISIVFTLAKVFSFISLTNETVLNYSNLNFKGQLKRQMLRIKQMIIS
jgi:hypothetical protein